MFDLYSLNIEKEFLSPVSVRNEGYLKTGFDRQYVYLPDALLGEIVSVPIMTNLGSSRSGVLEESVPDMIYSVQIISDHQLLITGKNQGIALYDLDSQTYQLLYESTKGSLKPIFHKSSIYFTDDNALISVNVFSKKIKTLMIEEEKGLDLVTELVDDMDPAFVLDEEDELEIYYFSQTKKNIYKLSVKTDRNLKIVNSSLKHHEQ